VLRRLEVEHLAILERVGLEFGPGLNVLSGETGAGKSLLLDALQLALGARADAGLIRQGEAHLHVSALFEVEAGSAAAQRCLALGLPPEDGALLLQREVARDNRGSCRVNGQLVTAGTLRDVGQALLSLLGQGESHRFAQPQAQLAFVDAYAGAEPLRREVATAHARWHAAVAARAALGGDSEERRRRRELLAFAVAEIDALAAVPDEEERLGARREQLAHAQRLLEGATATLSALWEGEAAVRDRLGAARRELGGMAAVDPSVAEAQGLLEQAAIAVDEAARSLRRYRDDLPFDPGEAAALEERWSQIQRCKRKYGGTLADVLAHRDAAAAEIGDIDASVAAAASKGAEIAACAEGLGRTAGELGGVRRDAALRLQAEVAAGLADLGMPGARLDIEMLTQPDPAGVAVGAERLACGERGCESANFIWAANAGEAGLPLGRAASGGELARLLLCLHSLRAEASPVPTLVFDEVDAGIGGRAAAAVALRLQTLGAARQVLCVTHLAIIAAAADRHFAIEKTETGGRTATTVRGLLGEARSTEVARMLDGGRAATSREHAQEMLHRFAR